MELGDVDGDMVAMDLAREAPPPPLDAMEEHIFLFRPPQGGGRCTDPTLQLLFVLFGHCNRDEEIRDEERRPTRRDAEEGGRWHAEEEGLGAGAAARGESREERRRRRQREKGLVRRPQARS